MVGILHCMVASLSVDITCLGYGVDGVNIGDSHNHIMARRHPRVAHYRIQIPSSHDKQENGCGYNDCCFFVLLHRE